MKTISHVCPAICKGKILTWCVSCGARIESIGRKRVITVLSIIFAITMYARGTTATTFVDTEKGMKRNHDEQQTERSKV